MAQEGRSKGVFLQAFLFTIIVFGVGLLLGFYLESSRGSEVEKSLINSELNLLDEQLRNKMMGELNVSCADAKESTFDFADRVYGEAIRLEKYDGAAKFLDAMIVMHKRYDLLRMMLWSEAMGIRERCGNDFHTIVYVYEYKSDDLGKRAVQNSLEKVLSELKIRHPKEILLIPMAGNLGLDSVNMVKKEFGIEELPAIIVDEKQVVRELMSIDEMEDAVFKNKGLSDIW